MHNHLWKWWGILWKSNHLLACIWLSKSRLLSDSHVQVYVQKQHFGDFHHNQYFLQMTLDGLLNYSYKHICIQRPITFISLALLGNQMDDHWAPCHKCLENGDAPCQVHFVTKLLEWRRAALAKNMSCSG